MRRRLERIERIDQRTAEASRKRLDGLRRWQRLPAGTSVEAVAPGEGAPGEWIAAPGVDARRTVFYLHGGAYTIGSPAIYRELCARLSAACGARVFAAAYRLAPEHPCPAAIDDAEVAWRWLQAHGVEPPLERLPEAVHVSLGPGLDRDGEHRLGALQRLEHH